MAKLPIVKPKKVIAALQRAGFFIDHQTGSHARLIHQTEPQRRVSVPVGVKNSIQDENSLKSCLKIDNV